MPTFVPLLNTVQAELCFTYNGNKVENVLHFYRSQDFNTPDAMETLAGNLKNWWDSYMKSQVPTTLFLRMVRVFDAENQNGQGVEYTNLLPIQGTAVSEGMPSNVTIAIKLSTGYRGRSYRGRIYHVGVCENEVAQDSITQAFSTALIDNYSFLLDPGNVNGYTWVVASKYHNGAPRMTGVTTNVTSISTDGVVDSQRRRLTGRGE